MSRKGLEIIGLVLTCAAVAALAGCGATTTVVGTNAEIESPVETVKINESEYKIDPANPTVTKNGLISIRATNVGQEYHALRLVVPGIDVENPAQIAETTIGEINPGKTGTLNVRLKPGKYFWYCPLSNHRRLGMKGQLRVE